MNLFTWRTRSASSLTSLNNHRTIRHFSLILRLTSLAGATVVSGVPVHAQSLYDTDLGSGIRQFNSSGVATLFGNSLSEYFGTAFYGSDLYVAGASSTGNYVIEKFNSSWVGTVFASTGLNNPIGLAFDSSGNLYVADSGNNTIEKFNSNGVGTVFASSGLNDPLGLAFDSSGNLYVSNNNGGINNLGYIEKFNSSGVGSQFDVSGTASRPDGLAFNSSGTLFVANQGDATIEEYTVSGAGTVFSFDAEDDPRGLAFDGSGNLYVLNGVTGASFAYIDKFTGSGSHSRFSQGDNNVGTDPIGLAFGSFSQQSSPTPEPGNLTLLTSLGIAGAGLLLRRRK